MLNSKGLAGYVFTQSGRKLAFAAYVNHLHLPLDSNAPQEVAGRRLAPSPPRPTMQSFRKDLDQLLDDSQESIELAIAVAEPMSDPWSACFNPASASALARNDRQTPNVALNSLHRSE